MCLASSTSRLRSRHWQLKSRSLVFSELPAIMGIVNVTPDSFSDGGNFFFAQAAIDQALRLEDQGADVLDIGGESTRPYSQPVASADELSRVLPVLERLIDRVNCPVSIDTSKPEVALAAVEMGAEIINDVTGFSNLEMLAIAANHRVGVCAMHMQGTPQTMQDAPSYTDVVAEICAYLDQRRTALLAGGIALENICLDPGIGFGKSHEHNIQLIQACRQFLELGCPILVGHSRKGFIAKLIGDKERQRDAGTVGVSLALALKGVQVLRVHDVQATRDALRCFAAAGGFE